MSQLFNGRSAEFSKPWQKCTRRLYNVFFPCFQFPGHTKPDVYLIDIDGNGRFPPAHVRCEFPSIEESTKTIVEHNLPSQMDVRSPSEQDFRYLTFNLFCFYTGKSKVFFKCCFLKYLIFSSNS